MAAADDWKTASGSAAAARVLLVSTGTAR